MSFTIRTIGDVTILDLGEVLTRASWAELSTCLASASAPRTGVLLNMASVSYMDGDGLDAVVHACTEVAGRYGRVKLLNIHPNVTRLLAATALASVIETFDTEIAALASFGGRPIAAATAR